jgi:membrane-bound lytic murein transglycosylase D
LTAAFFRAFFAGVDCAFAAAFCSRQRFFVEQPQSTALRDMLVDKQVDERTNLEKSTRASCRFLRELILDFGAGSSVMLALAAYNLGPSKVKQAVMNTVRDPIKQRDFWYLYRVNALPRETREYVPKVVAANDRRPQPAAFRVLTHRPWRSSDLRRSTGW